MTVRESLSERQKRILDAVVQDYIDTAHPVASQELVVKYRLPFSSATVRNELSDLEEFGYLEQPHTSAGRIPTDAGYRMFVDEIESRPKPVLERERLILDELFTVAEEDFFAESARMISRMTGGFAATGSLNRNLCYKAGVSEVLDEPESNDRDFSRGFGDLVDLIDERIQNTFQHTKDRNTHVFIGEENPIREARQFGMIVSFFAREADPKNFVVILGPKRMDYMHNMSLITYLHDYGHTRQKTRGRR